MKQGVVEMKIKLNIKNLLAFTILAIMITSISLFFMNTSFAADTATVTVETANIRESADTNATILDLVNKGESVEILETSGEWSKIKYKNIVGYLRNDLLSLENANVENTENTVVESQNQTVENVETPQNTEAEPKTSEVQTTDILGKYKAKQDMQLKVIPLIHALDLEKISKDTEAERH